MKTPRAKNKREVQLRALKRKQFLVMIKLVIRKGYTPKLLAQMLEVTNQGVSDWYTGKKVPILWIVEKNYTKLQGIVRHVKRYTRA